VEIYTTLKIRINFVWKEKYSKKSPETHGSISFTKSYKNKGLLTFYRPLYFNGIYVFLFLIPNADT